MVLVIFGLVFAMPILTTILSSFHFTTTISKYLKKNSSYTYETSITGNEKQSADVYRAPAGYTIETTARDIINAIEGDTEYVQQDDAETEGALAILTDKEYCVIYMSLEDTVLVQVSDREYAYTTDDDLYHGTSHARRYYRGFYYSNGYYTDDMNYGSKYTSPYSSYDGDIIEYSSSNVYNSYSNSIRQSSIAARSSSGGGLSGGK